MPYSIKIDTRFLKTRVASKFNVRKRASFERAYQMALDHIANLSDLPYVPAAYIFPCLIQKEIEVESVKLRRVFFNITCIDPEDLTKLAIFPSIYIVKRLPPKHVTSSMAHELAHVMDLGGSVEGFLKYMNIRLQEGYVTMAKMQEHGAKTAYERFKEPIKSWLYEWDKKVATGKDKETITREAQFMDYDYFWKYTLGDKYEKVMEDLVRRMKSKLKL